MYRESCGHLSYRRIQSLPLSLVELSKMMSKLLRTSLLLLAVAALCSCEEGARVKRRVKPRPKKPLTLEELHFEVRRIGMENCTHINNDFVNSGSLKYSALHCVASPYHH